MPEATRHRSSATTGHHRPPTVRDADFPTRPVLICFRTAEDDLEPLTDWYHIIAIQTHQLRPPKATGETYQEQCSIPDIFEPRSHGFQD
jgi:hypothetical protein